MRIPNLNTYGGGQYLEPGVHDVHVYDLTYKTINANDAVDIVFKAENGATVKDTLWLTEKAYWKVNLLAKACGFTDDEMIDFDTEQLRGMAVQVKIIKETSEKDGKNYSRVKDYAPIQKEKQKPIAEFDNIANKKKSNRPVKATEPDDFKDFPKGSVYTGANDPF